MLRRVKGCISESFPKHFQTFPPLYQVISFGQQTDAYYLQTNSIYFCKQLWLVRASTIVVSTVEVTNKSFTGLKQVSQLQALSNLSTSPPLLRHKNPELQQVPVFLYDKRGLHRNHETSSIGTIDYRDPVAEVNVSNMRKIKCTATFTGELNLTFSKRSNAHVLLLNISAFPAKVTVP